MSALALGRSPRWRLRALVLAAVAVTVIASVWVVWRFYGPVEVRIVGQAANVPFTIETIPSVVYARPGEVVSVIYRIRNTQLMPVTAIGRIEVSPQGAADQMQIFLTQCAGVNTFQAAYSQDYQVMFRVAPAGLSGAQQISLYHIFTRATPE
jgi:cytochrome c oxidase assembly protein Cox11